MRSDSHAIPLPIGSLVADRYEVDNVLGCGAMGWVVRAKDRTLNDRFVALKVLHTHLIAVDRSVERFRNEVVLARRLSHPGIVTVYDCGTTAAGQHFLSMEYIPGCSLRDELTRHPEGLPFELALSYFSQIVSSISHAHEQGVIHRDIKPDNVLLTADGQLKVTDFGIARALDESNQLTRTGEMIGTPYYMAPEQILGEIADTRSDVYALGIIAYELFTGSRPFEESNLFRLSELHLQQDIIDFRTSGNAIPFWIRDIIQKATAKSASERYPSARELEEAIRVRRLRGFQALRAIFRPYVRALYPRSRLLAPILFIFIISLCLILLVRGDWVLRRRVTVQLLKFEAESSIPLGVVARLFDAEMEYSEEYFLRCFRAPVKPNHIIGLIEGGMNPNARNRWGSVLEQTLLLRLTTIADLLLRNGANPNDTTRNGTPLLIAATKLHGSFSMIRIFLDAGADANVRDSNGMTALHHAVLAKEPLTIHALLKEADVNLPDPRGATPLMLATDDGSHEIIKLLIANGADVNRSDRNGVTALLRALSNRRQPSIIKILLEAGANLSHQANDGTTVWDLLTDDLWGTMIKDLLSSPET